MARRRASAVLIGAAWLLGTAGCAGGGTAPESGARDRAPSVVAALGDSITRGYGLCDGWGDCPEASWATGTRPSVASHATRLGQAGAAPRVHNLAVSGARVAGLEAQARRAVEARADYVTVLIGANDACAYSESTMTPTRRFADAFAATVDTLADGLPEARILVVSIPDLRRLWRVGRDDERAVQAWRRMGVCQAMLANPTSSAPDDDARRARVRRQVAAYNRVMAVLCGRHANCRWDGGAVFEQSFDLDAVSPRDYWHPGVAGQRRLADVAWRAGYFD